MPLLPLERHLLVIIRLGMQSKTVHQRLTTRYLFS